MADEQPNNNGTPPGTDPTKTAQPEAPQTLDLSKISDDEFGKIYEDPRLFNHPRFKELNAKATRAKELEAEKAEAEKVRLKEQGEFEKLAKQNEESAKTWEQKFKNSLVDNKILAEAQRLGAQDTEAVLKLVDKSKVTIDANDNVSGAEEAVKQLIEAKPYLKGSTQSPTLGAAANPGNANQGLRKFKLSEIQNAEFYRANRDEIRAAQKAGLIENDLN